jgi:hypothetical protein
VSSSRLTPRLSGFRDGRAGVVDGDKSRHSCDARP